MDTDRPVRRTNLARLIELKRRPENDVTIFRAHDAREFAAASEQRLRLEAHRAT